MSWNWKKKHIDRKLKRINYNVEDIVITHSLCSSFARLHPLAATLSSEGGHYLASNYASIYNFPPRTNNPAAKVVIGVVSFGGGLVGTATKVSSPTGTTAYLLQNNKSSDVYNYWVSCGISPSNMPTVYMVQLAGAANPTSSPTSSTNIGATAENTIDVSTIGACCNGSGVTIVVYFAPNSISGFSAAFSAAINGNILNGALVKPNVISCSWGAAEILWGSGFALVNTVLSQTTVPICVATGDTGASDGLAGFNVNFPASSQYVIACGGTSLYNPSLDYKAPISEVAWSGSGGGISSVIAKPSWQTVGANISTTKRLLPDIAMNADPNTGVQYLIGNTTYIYGGTSIVAPAMAALIANSINPAKYTLAKIYSAAPTFHQITSGSNFGFIAVEGYDCCTGIGSPNGRLLDAAVTSA